MRQNTSQMLSKHDDSILDVPNCIPDALKKPVKRKSLLVQCLPDQGAYATSDRRKTSAAQKEEGHCRGRSRSVDTCTCHQTSAFGGWLMSTSIFNNAGGRYKAATPRLRSPNVVYIGRAIQNVRSTLVMVSDFLTPFSGFNLAP